MKKRLLTCTLEESRFFSDEMTTFIEVAVVQCASILFCVTFSPHGNGKRAHAHKFAWKELTLMVNYDDESTRSKVCIEHSFQCEVQKPKPLAVVCTHENKQL